MKKKSNKLKIRKLLYPTILLFVILYLLFFHEANLLDVVVLKYKNKELKNKITQLKKDNVELKEMNKKLKNDPEEIERIARTRFGMIKEGEKVYRFQNEDSEDDKEERD